MGDIWPYGPPKFSSWNIVYNWFVNNGFTTGQAATFAAIAEAEASFDLSVINDTQSTGDYSVGEFQINYFGYLYGTRVALFGTPQQLIAGGNDAQCRAAHYLWSGRGGNWTDWSTYTSGAYRKYLNGDTSPANTAGEAAGGSAAAAVAPIRDYSATIADAGDQITITNQSFLDGTLALRTIKDGNPHG